MAQIPAEWRCAWQQSGAQVRLIARVAGDLRQRQAEIAALGATVTHSFRLTNALSLECAGSVALCLAQQPWVLSLTLDTPVQALGRHTHG